MVIHGAHGIFILMDFNLMGFSWILGGFMCFYGLYTKYGSSTVGFYGGGMEWDFIAINYKPNDYYLWYVDICP